MPTELVKQLCPESANSCSIRSRSLVMIVIIIAIIIMMIVIAAVTY